MQSIVSTLDSELQIPGLHVLCLANTFGSFTKSFDYSFSRLLGRAVSRASKRTVTIRRGRLGAGRLGAAD